MKNKIRSSNHAIQTLREIQKAGHETAIIAGGAIRDLYHDAPISDYDVFIQHPSSDQTIHRAPAMPPNVFKDEEWVYYWANVMNLRSNDFTTGDKVLWFYSEYQEPEDEVAVTNGIDLSNDVMAVWNVYKGHQVYQIIFLKCNPIEYVNEKFDFGICKAYTDGQKIHYTSDFLTDSRNKTITFVGQGLTKHQYEYAMVNHLPRILRKYPGYRLIDPGTQEI